jgi:hypothetical protein
MRSVALLIAVLSAAASPASAACQNDAQVFSCQIGQKTLQVCHWKGALIYQFGPEDRWELSITEPLETADFKPWNGIGRYIWETLTFRNKGVSYEIWTSVERGPDATTGLEGAVTIREGDAELARLTCNPGTASTSLDSINDLKSAIGQCWDYESQTWTTACN